MQFTQDAIVKIGQISATDERPRLPHVDGRLIFDVAGSVRRFIGPSRSGNEPALAPWLTESWLCP